jgi:hypothetical protein
MKCCSAILLALSVLIPHPASAQTPQPPPERTDPDSRLQPLQPDFNLVALPTTLRMPVYKWGFRVTHRFTRALGEGDFGDLVSDLFGLDSGAQIGLELRFGLLPGTQIGVHRTSDRTIQIFGQQSVLVERDSRAQNVEGPVHAHAAPIGLDITATFEGANNLQERHQSAMGIVVSRSAWRHAAFYAEPLFVVNTNPFAVGDNHTFMVGFGGRLRVRPAMYLVAEVTPRLAGYDPGNNQVSFGFEGRAGGHLFQLNFSNGYGTTFGQLALGGFEYDDWRIGFNISRKFF